MAALKSLVVLALLALVYPSPSEASIHCYSCPPEGIPNAELDCRNPENNYLGEAVSCRETEGKNGDLCLKVTGKKEDFSGLPSSANYAELVFRGCVDTSDPSPFDDGEWKVKNRCKKVDGVKTCTCKDDEMCNAADGLAVSKMLIPSLIALLAARLCY